MPDIKAILNRERGGLEKGQTSVIMWVQTYNNLFSLRDVATKVFDLYQD